MIAHIQGRHGNSGRDTHAVRVAVRMGLWSATVLSLPLMGILAFTHPLLLAFHQDAGLARDAATFMSGLCWGLPFALGFQVLRSFSTALSRAVPPLVVIAAGNPVERAGRLRA